MKSIYKYLTLALSFPILFSSCLKDDELIGPDADGAFKNVIEFKNIAPIKSTTTSPYPVYVPSTLDPEVPEVTVNAIVRYAGVEDAPEDITVELGIDANIVSEYNSSQSGTYVSLPVENYEFPSSVVIKKGEREALVPIKLHVDKFDKTKENVLPIVIKSTTSSAPVSGNFGKIILSFPVKSIWEGSYKYSIINPAEGNDSEEGKTLSTVGPNLVEAEGLFNYYSGWTRYQFDSENTTVLQLSAFSGSALAVSNLQTVTVDAENRIFEVKWTVLGRNITERFERIGD